jgi:hypothetical protein
MGGFWLMSWWKMRPDCYAFNPMTGDYDEVFLVARDGPNRSIVRASNGLEASVGNVWLSKDPAHIKMLRMNWEAAQVKVANGN